MPNSHSHKWQPTCVVPSFRWISHRNARTHTHSGLNFVGNGCPSVVCCFQLEPFYFHAKHSRRTKSFFTRVARIHSMKGIQYRGWGTPFIFYHSGSGGLPYNYPVVQRTQHTTLDKHVSTWTTNEAIIWALSTISSKLNSGGLHKRRSTIGNGQRMNKR